MIKEYMIVCPSCHGSGFIPNPEPGITSLIYVTCPACDGKRTVLVREYSGEDISFEDKKRFDNWQFIGKL